MRLTADELATAVRDGRGPNGDTLEAETREALRATLSPVRLVVVAAQQAGANERSETRFALAAQGSVTAQDASAGALDLALLPSVTLAIVMIDDLLGLSRTPAMTGPALSLTLTAFATLCAAADATQAAALRSRVERASAARLFALTADVCETQLRDGLAGIDSRWAVTAAHFALAADLAAATGRCADGLRELESAGLISGGAFTRPGDELAITLGQITACGRVTLVTGGESAIVAPLGVLRTVTAIWFCSYDAASGRVTLAPVAVAGALEALRLMFEGDLAVSPRSEAATPAASLPRAARFCSSCGAALAPGARFCGACGERI